MLAELDDADDRVTALARAATLLVEAQSLDAARYVAAAITQPEVRDRTEEKLALALARSGDPEPWLALIRRKPSAAARVGALGRAAEQVLKKPEDDLIGLRGMLPRQMRP